MKKVKKFKTINFTTDLVEIFNSRTKDMRNILLLKLKRIEKNRNFVKNMKN